MFDYQLWFGFVLSVVVFLSTPGPVTVMVANHGASNGLMASLCTVIGTNLASLVLIGVSLLVLFGVVGIDERWLSALTLVGSLYIIYFAFSILTELKQVSQLSLYKHQADRQGLITHLKQGFLVGIANPKDVLFFIGFFPLFFGVAESKVVAATTLTITWVVLDYAILLVYAYLFSKICKPKFIKLTMLISALLLLGLGAVGVIKSVMDFW
ncbi:LysE family translocator [Moraxella cuniculi]|uniref:Homoserine/homoserine lactone efflux protein n=1 Tax=Moraxella cuniculi TaxID=34061 RepID=A0A3S4UV80_9GAMM|nr:LysE family transporter [Moraxella cuniculi]VEG13806.1 Homoserine/homoserine lactone efflux protein [Moraxella cuniculi]